ncbi:MAG TPA: redoxin domain-containing protein [Terriglobales bacterium]|nr:redoxin domain-containing protein [Terriglobales bacterium]
MRVEKGKVRAPEIGRVWLNSPPLSFRQLRGRVVLVDFWDYTCINCIRTLPYVQAWHERYVGKGLTVIGVHTPEFTFAQYESNVERGVREFGLTYPIVVDNDREIWKAFANRYWPTKYLLDKEGYLRYAHFGEGTYRECEEAIRELLLEVNSTLAFPPLMEPVRPEDGDGAVCYPPSGELYLGHARARIGNEGGLQEDSIAEYSLPNEFKESHFYLSGRWASTAEYVEAAGEDTQSIVVQYEAAGVNLVMAAPRGGACDVIILQDGKPLDRLQKAADTRFRSKDGIEESYVTVQQARMYTLLKNGDFGKHVLELRCPAGLAVFAVTFTSCVDPSREAVAATESQS